MADIILEKQKLRDRLLRELQTRTSEFASKSLQIATQLKLFVLENNLQHKNCTIFANRHDEADISEFLKSDFKSDWIFPKVVNKDLFWCQSRFQDLSAGFYGILEPQAGFSKVISSNQIACYFVPGLGFDRAGHRLGRGKGFYDRGLKGVTTKKVGICFSFQVVDHIPTDEKADVDMDYIITENEVISCSKKLLK